MREDRGIVVSSGVLTHTHQVSRIKERVEEKEGIPPAQQRLIYGGKQMYVFLPILPARLPSLAIPPPFRSHCFHSTSIPPLSNFHRSRVHSARDANTRCPRADDKTAADYSLEGGATLHLVLALRGGGL